MILFTTCALAFGLLGGEPPSLAETEPETEKVEELFFAQTAYPQERHSLQVTLVGLYLNGNDTHDAEAVLELEYGITDRFQLGLELPALWRETDGSTDSGPGDIEFGALFALTEPGKPFTLSVAGAFRFPTGDEEQELGEENAAFEPALLSSWDTGPVILHAAVGVEMGPDDRSLNYSAAVEAPVNDFSFVAELAGESEEEATELYAVAGIIWRFADDAEFGLGAPVGLTEAAADWGVIATFTVEF
jgi:hypothetical protein